jgi:circadian clock protein KaiC
LADANNHLERIPTGIAGLDAIVLGGLFNGALYIVEGAPGSGKTILGSQIAFQHVAKGGRTLFVTLAAEPVPRMLQNLSFFDEGVIPGQLRYLSGAATIDGGAGGIVEAIRRSAEDHGATLIVLDGLNVARQLAEREPVALIRELREHAIATGCLVLVLDDNAEEMLALAYALADGVIHLRHERSEYRTERNLEVSKFRGGNHLQGLHPFRISDDGLMVYPRIETVYAVPPVRDRYRPLRMETGVAGLDYILRGGLPSETSNALFGPTGSGKTTFSLQYIGRSSAIEPGLFFGMYETPERLRVKAHALGIDLEGLEDRGDLEILWKPQGERILDELGHLLIDAVRRRGVKRLVIDGYGGLVESATSPSRISLFISTLSNTLRALNATTILTMEARDFLGSDLLLPAYGLSSLLEGLMVLRYVELKGKIHRVLSITKIRDSDFDPAIREIRMTDRGLVVEEPIQGMEAVMSGFAREPRGGRA